MPGWSLDDVQWERFDAERVEPAIVPLVKAASLVEANAPDYREYLCNVFADDARFRRAVEGWTVEEQRHGEALARWARLADPTFDFDRALAAFLAGFRIEVTQTESVRGSRSGELVARCMVETGTNSFYTALAEATDEPVLKDVCRRIAADEEAHYRMFHRHMTRYIARENLTRRERLRVALSRIAETEDDELSYAWYAANGAGEPYDRRRHGGAYHRAALAYYTPGVVQRAVGMVFEAVGLRRDGPLSRAAALLGRAMVGGRRLWLARFSPAPGETAPSP